MHTTSFTVRNSNIQGGRSICNSARVEGGKKAKLARSYIILWCLFRLVALLHIIIFTMVACLLLVWVGNKSKGGGRIGKDRMML